MAYWFPRPGVAPSAPPPTLQRPTYTPATLTPTSNNINPAWYGLMQAGAATLANADRGFAPALGSGILGGLESYLAEQRRRRDEELAAEERRYQRYRDEMKDYQSDREFEAGRADRAEDVKWRQSEADREQRNWQSTFDESMRRFGLEYGLDRDRLNSQIAQWGAQNALEREKFDYSKESDAANRGLKSRELDLESQRLGILADETAADIDSKKASARKTNIEADKLENPPAPEFDQDADDAVMAALASMVPGAITYDDKGKPVVDPGFMSDLTIDQIAAMEDARARTWAETKGDVRATAAAMLRAAGLDKLQYGRTDSRLLPKFISPITYGLLPREGMNEPKPVGTANAATPPSPAGDTPAPTVNVDGVQGTFTGTYHQGKPVYMTQDGRRFVVD